MHILSEITHDNQERSFQALRDKTTKYGKPDLIRNNLQRNFIKREKCGGLAGKMVKEDPKLTLSHGYN